MTRYLIPLFATLAISGCNSLPASDNVSQIEVYKYSMSRQCDNNSGISVDIMAGELKDAGIQVMASRSGNDGMMRMALCGSDTGEINIYSIPEQQLQHAVEVGFQPVSSLDK